MTELLTDAGRVPQNLEEHHNTVLVQPVKRAQAPNNTIWTQPSILVLLQMLDPLRNRQCNATHQRISDASPQGQDHLIAQTVLMLWWHHAGCISKRTHTHTHTNAKLPSAPLSTPEVASEGGPHGSSLEQTVSLLCAITGSPNTGSDATLGNFIVDQSKLLGLPCLLLPLVHHNWGNHQGHKCEQAHNCDPCLATLRLGPPWQGFRSIPAQTDTLLSSSHHHNCSLSCLRLIGTKACTEIGPRGVEQFCCMYNRQQQLHEYAPSFSSVMLQ